MGILIEEGVFAIFFITDRTSSMLAFFMVNEKTLVCEYVSAETYKAQQIRKKAVILIIRFNLGQ